MAENYDFSGWATKNDILCADGRVIRKDAFKAQNGMKVPLIWNHQHGQIGNVLGHAILENRDEGVYAYGYLNNTSAGKDARECLIHGDVEALSIWANNLDQRGSDVFHGTIREVSIVQAGANPGAFVESVLAHGLPQDESEDEAIIYSGEQLTDIVVSHSIDTVNNNDDEDEVTVTTETAEDDTDNELAHSDDSTVGEILATLNDDQKAAVGVLIDAVANNNDSNEEENDDMKHSVFESNAAETNYISHSDMEQIFADAKRLGSLRDAVNENFEEGGVLAHSVPMDGMVGPSDTTASQSYGFRDPDMLFPEYRNMGSGAPEFISRDMTWVQKVMSGVHRSPFSRIKTQFADITEDAARAKGYIKGNLKKEEVFTLLKRTTDPQTIYKKQKLDRDDMIDITDFDVVAWIKGEMRTMLNEEIARAILIGDGRLASSDDKIQENHVRPIVNDVDLFNVKVPVTQASDPKETINAVIRARKNYKGSGNPTFFTTEDVVTEMLLLEDGIGHKLYKTESELATALRVKDIVTVEAMEGYNTTIGGKSYPLIGIIVNLTDYNVGADKGGEINLFDDFDIDYNQYKYLMETRISGALIKPFSALTVYDASGSTQNADVDDDF